MFYSERSRQSQSPPTTQSNSRENTIASEAAVEESRLRGNRRKNKPSPKRLRLTASSEESAIGYASESNAQHANQHAGSIEARNCMRCVYIHNKDEWRKQFPWLDEKPGYLGGLWRMGCFRVRVAQGKQANRKKQNMRGGVVARFGSPSSLTTISSLASRGRVTISAVRW